MLDMRTFCLGLFLLCGAAACTSEHDHKGRTPLVELDGHFLYREDLQKALPAGLSGEDSLLFAEEYIRNWAEDLLLYDKARHNIPDNEAIELLVANYRKSLIMHAYQQELINQQLAKELTEEELLGYYESNRELFKVERPLIKGLFIKVPLKAPQLSNVRRWYKSQNQEAVEHLEKYSLQHAVKYDYFYDRWVPVGEMLDLIPLEVTDADNYLDKHRQLELKDTAFHYFLNISDYRRAGEQEPYEFARAQVKEMLLNLKQVEFMKQVKDDLYERAEKRHEIKYY